MSFKFVQISINIKTIVQNVVTIHKGNDVQPQKLKPKKEKQNVSSEIFISKYM